MPAIAHPGRLLKRELEARGLSGNRLALDLGVPSGRITDILNGRRGITADTALRLGRAIRPDQERRPQEEAPEQRDPGRAGLEAGRWHGLPAPTCKVARAATLE